MIVLSLLPASLAHSHSLFRSVSLSLMHVRPKTLLGGWSGVEGGGD